MFIGELAFIRSFTVLGICGELVTNSLESMASFKNSWRVGGDDLGGGDKSVIA